MDDLIKVLVGRIDMMISEAEYIRSVIVGQVDYETQEKLYEKKQAAAMLGVSYRTINRWLCEGLLQGVTLGHRTKFKESELVEFRNRHKDDSGCLKIDRRDLAPRTFADIQEHYKRQASRL